MSNGFLAALTAAALLLSGAARAQEAPRVVVDIAPVHSLVAAVMEGVGTPELLVKPGTDPHDFALRPSQARALQEADIVIFTGSGLTPLRAATIAGLSPDAALIDWMEIEEGTVHLMAGDDDHDHDDGHDHGAVDPHAWLDPANAIAWQAAFAEVLASADPANAPVYRGNSDRLADELRTIATRIEASFAGMPPPRYLVAHDAFRYFEERFGVPSLGAVTGWDGAAASAGRMADLRATVEAAAPACILAGSTTDPDLMAAIAPGVQVIEADPEGAGLEPGPGLYSALMDRLAAAIAGCG
ncbi:zinc ABC transporter solute-binding protein [Rhodobacterales bacterium HKCCE3408]|nr:zinc ABC transporter solute-binding protein [Rhodobacterales bacterium HKCCE3408]